MKRPFYTVARPELLGRRETEFRCPCSQQLPQVGRRLESPLLLHLLGLLGLRSSQMGPSPACGNKSPVPLVPVCTHCLALGVPGGYWCMAPCRQEAHGSVSAPREQWLLLPVWGTRAATGQAERQRG